MADEELVEPRNVARLFLEEHGYFESSDTVRIWWRRARRRSVRMVVDAGVSVAGAGRVRARALMSPLAAEAGEVGAHGVGGGGRQGGDLPVGDGRGPSSRCGAGPGAPGPLRPPRLQTLIREIGRAHV